jgi:hypothetical protein
MEIITRDELDQFYKRLIVTDNASIYEPKEGRPPYHRQPHCLYFYYIRFLADGMLYVKHYFHDNGKDAILPTELAPLIRKLTLNARNDEESPPSTGSNWRNMKWRRRSYFVIVMDSKNWTFVPNRALTFNPEKGSVPNQSFFDGVDITVDTSAAGDGSETITGIQGKNHMKKNKDGDDIDKDTTGKPESQRFVFTLSFDVAGFPNDVHTIDPGGENTGPAVPPPST